MARLRLPLLLRALARPGLPRTVRTLVLAAAVALAALPAGGARAGGQEVIARVAAIGITVSDMEKALAF
ncbi:MAG TPA: hypothetical protein VLA62_11240 [Solirubrobacterales bacterium]|nr:hypothetical protein [Solirubrobacterales bacterium]